MARRFTAAPNAAAAGSSVCLGSRGHMTNRMPRYRICVRTCPNMHGYTGMHAQTISARSWVMAEQVQPAIRACPDRRTAGRRRLSNSPCEKKYNPCCLKTVALLPASFSHPDCYCRLRNCTGSTVPSDGLSPSFRPGSRADAGSLRLCAAPEPRSPPVGTSTLPRRKRS